MNKYNYGQRSNGNKYCNTNNNLSSQFKNTMNKTDSIKSTRKYDNQSVQRQELIENMKELVRSEVFNTLLLIKNEIQSKIKQIDSEIKKIRQEYVNLKQINDINIENILQKIQTIDSTVRSIPKINLEQKYQSTKNNLNQNTNHNKVLMKQRSKSKQKKTIFCKTENSVNLSSILFPQENKKQTIQFLQEDIQNIDTTIKIIPFLQEINVNQIMSKEQFKENIKQQSINEQLIKNKSRFLKKKNKPQLNESNRSSTVQRKLVTSVSIIPQMISKYNVQSIKQQQNQDNSFLYENFR